MEGNRNRRMAGVIHRGDMWIVDLDPGFGRELRKKRPALIISTNAIQQAGVNAIIVPASSQVPKTIGIEMVPIGKKEGLTKPSVLLPVFIRHIDQKRLMKKIGSLSKGKLREVEKAINVVLGL